MSIIQQHANRNDTTEFIYTDILRQNESIINTGNQVY